MILSVTIVLRQLPQDSRYLSVLLRCLDSSIPFYAGGLLLTNLHGISSLLTRIVSTGVRINFHFHAGYPSVRHIVAKKFADLDGFRIFLEFLKLPESGWLGTDKLQIIMRTLSEVMLGACRCLVACHLFFCSSPALLTKT
jgi:hypothetical protein